MLIPVRASSLPEDAKFWFTQSNLMDWIVEKYEQKWRRGEKKACTNWLLCCVYNYHAILLNYFDVEY